MLQVWINRTQILQQQFDGIHLPLAEEGGGGLGGRRLHGRGERRARQQTYAP